MSEGREQTKHYMSWSDKIKATEKIMKILDETDVKDGDREQELIDILELAAKLLLPYRHVKLLSDLF